MRILVIAGLALVLGTTIAHAQTPCCANKPCQAYDAQGRCTTPNAGKRCLANDLNNVLSIPNRGAVSGCIEDGTNCIGGATTPSGPTGCTGIGGYYGTDEKTTNATELECTNRAVDACCEYEACG
jgi:hypothetical protein